PAGGEPRIARDQLQQGMLRRPGSGDPRAAPRPRPRCAETGRPARRRRRRAGAGDGDSKRRARDRRGHQQHAVAGAAAADCARLCAPRLRGAWDRPDRRRRVGAGRGNAIRDRLVTSGSFVATATTSFQWPGRYLPAPTTKATKNTKDTKKNIVYS